MLCSDGTSAARGVAICVKKGTDCIIRNVNCDSDGRYIMCQITHMDSTFVLMNLYAPNKDSPGFFDEAIKKCMLCKEKAVIVGDFNTVLNAEIDRKSQKMETNLKSTVRLNELTQEYMLKDVWRSRNPDVRRYSWMRTKPKICASRIDFALISAGLDNSVHDCFYLTGVHTDHSALFVGLDLEPLERGASYWKFNTSMLSDSTFAAALKTQIQQCVMESESLPPLERWEVLKAHIKSTAMSLTRARASEEQLVISQLSERTLEMETRVETMTEEEAQLYINTKAELEELLSKKVKSAIFRTKAQWSMEAEKNSRYFFNLEKARYNAKICTKIFNKNGSLITKPEEVLEGQRCFYSELYTTDPKVKFNLEVDLPNTVSDDDVASSEDTFSEEEIKVAIKGLKNNSCPGSDGLPIEVYKMYWNDIKEVLISVINTIYENGEIHRTGRQGVLNLLPKGDKDTRYLANMRPITLLNCDYKICEKMIANRMMPALGEIIHSDQNGFIPDRRIAANIRKILDLVHTANEENINCIVITCDWMKCFDRIEFTAIENAMKKFKFSNMLIRWVQILYRDFYIKVQNNGSFSKPISISRGIRQGGPASNAIFLTVAELLAVTIRQDRDVHGVSVKEIMQLLNQYADDTDISILNEEKSFNRVMYHLENFGRHTGFKLNYDKTTVYRVGSAKEANAKHYTGKELKWTKESINVLGVDIAQTDEEVLKINYEKLLKSSQQTINRWENRNLTLIGKVEVINTLVASLFVYRMTSLPAIPAYISEKFNKMIEEYIWNKAKPKIPLEVLQSLPEDGGLGLVDIVRKDMAIKASWVKMVMEDKYPEGRVYNYLIPELEGNIWCCNIAPHDVREMPISNKFWKDVLYAWATYHYTAEKEQEQQIIWWNSNIRVQNKPIWYAECAKRGLMYVEQLYQEMGKEWISDEEALAKYALDTMRFNAIKSATPVEYKTAASTGTP